MLAINNTQLPVLPQASLVPVEPLRSDNQKIPLVTPAKPSHGSVASKSIAEQRTFSERTESEVTDARETEGGDHQIVRSRGDSGDSSREGADGENSPESSDSELQAQLRELKKRDRDVRAHEKAHAAVGGDIAGAPRFVFKKGPDGRLYAVDGEVPISTRPIAGAPERTIAKLERVIRAALAPVQPSTQDIRVATQAAAMIAQLKAELAAAGSGSGQEQEAPRLLGDRSILERRIRASGAAEAANTRVGQSIDKVA